MKLLNRDERHEIDPAVRTDRSANFIYTFALGMPKSLTAVKAASDRYDGSRRAPATARRWLGKTSPNVSLHGLERLTWA